MDKNSSKLVTADVEEINKELKKVYIDNKFKKFIDKNIYYLKNNLKDIIQIKTHGSYATGELYNFDKQLNIDLLAIKYVNRNMYKIYEQEIETREHFDDCWICELNKEIFNRVSTFYKVANDIKVSWVEKKYRSNYPKKIITFADSIKITFYKEGSAGFSIIIRTAIKHNDFLPVICNKTMYNRTFTLDYVKTFRTLNKLLVKKLQILFYYVRIKFRNLLTRQERLFLKIAIMSEIQYDLTKSNHLQRWLDYAFDYNFSSKKEVDNVLESKYIFYKRTKKIAKFYNSFKLKNLNWVFNKTYPTIKVFLDKYFEYISNFLENKDKNMTGNFFFWYDSVAYLKNTMGSTTISIKKESQKYDNLELQIHSRTIYPTNKENGLFLIFLQYFTFEIERD
ncbi:hypothetical protein [Spiroplasma cantharicola]|uniref:Uncharacterized protein n=1 Tax=Spiroplasma cantharicola TaxID=362837 RepID=A0A0M4JJC6_9MOLU|nr:hypothetical protein [Spiroplasma cantharicola]ALD66261.1 hypothetical protein SCANT_v1c03510 [Spiroplasma cantharicola]